MLSGIRSGSRTLIALGDQLGHKGHDVFPEGARDSIQKEIPKYRQILEEADLQLSLDSFERFVDHLAKPGVTTGQLGESAEELQNRIGDELSHMLLWQVTREDARFLDVDPFGADVSGKFPSARDDIEEAGKCLAFGRATACVFHLMRVMEVGLRALSASLNDPTLDPKTNPTWENILGRCDRELAKPLAQRSAEWRKDEPFFSTASANLRSVKDAWRNPTLHVERKYTEEEARDVWYAVRGSIRHLAIKLSA